MALLFLGANPVIRCNQFDGARWSQSLVAWHLPDTEENRIKYNRQPLF